MVIIWFTLGWVERAAATHFKNQCQDRWSSAIPVYRLGQPNVVGLNDLGVSMTLLEHTLCGLNQLVLSRVSEQRFKIITPIPKILSPLFRQEDDQYLDVDESWPFLHHFLYDAQLHWQEQHQAGFGFPDNKFCISFCIFNIFITSFWHIDNK